MKAQYENLLMSSMMLYIDHLICKEGEGYKNFSSKFYPTQKKFNQYHSLSLPYKQIIADTSVTGANVLQGVTIDGAFKTVGESGLAGILHHKGTLLFDIDMSGHDVVGNFAVKDFNVYITTKAEHELLFKTAKQVNPKLAQTEEGLDPNTEAYPAIFLKNMGGLNEEFSFGGIDNNITNVRAVVLASSAFNLDAVCSLLKRSAHKHIKILNNLPFNAIGAYTNVSFDYEALAAGTAQQSYVKDVRMTKIMPDQAGMQNLNMDVFAAFVDFEIHSLGTH